jgi:dTDP-glucose pyrophosphorylase/CBS domain-containing protein
MNSDTISMFIGDSSIKVVDAMEKIDKNSKGLLFIVDEMNSLIGCITDGDIRRWLLKAGELSAPVVKVMNTTPMTLLESDKQSAFDFLRKNFITAVPIVDCNNCIKDIVTLSDETSESQIYKKGNLSGIPVVVMAGGKGTRLYPYTKILPKPLIPIGETPIVERIINCFTEYGMDKFYMTVNYKKGMIRSYFDDLEPDYSITYVEEDMPLGTGGGIKLINDKFNKPLFVTNCDALIFADYADIYDYHVKSGNAITVVSALKNITVPYGVVHSGENGVLKEMEEKPKLSYFVNTGMYIINPETIELIPDGVLFHMTHLVERVMKNGGKVGTYPISEDSFLDMGEFDEMKRMEQKLNIISEK